MLLGEDKLHIGNVSLPDRAYIPAYWATTGCCLNVVNSGQILTLALLQKDARGAGGNVSDILKVSFVTEFRIKDTSKRKG